MVSSCDHWHEGSACGFCLTVVGLLDSATAGIQAGPGDGRNGTLIWRVQEAPPGSWPEKAKTRVMGAANPEAASEADTLPFAGILVLVQKPRFWRTPSIRKLVSVVATPAFSVSPTLYG